MTPCENHIVGIDWGDPRRGIYAPLYATLVFVGDYKPAEPPQSFLRFQHCPECGEKLTWPSGDEASINQEGTT